MDEQKSNSTKYLDILFANRNKDYGAYLLREMYNYRVRNAILLVTFVNVIIVSGVIFFQKLNASQAIEMPKITPAELISLDDLDLNIKEKENTTFKSGKAKTEVKSTKHTSVKVIKDKDKNSSRLRTQKELDKEDNIQKQKHEGNLTKDKDSTSKGNDSLIVDNTPSLEDKDPEYPGGEQALLAYLKSQIKYPTEAKSKKIEGQAIVEFIVEPNGSISNIKIIKSLGYGCDEEVLRVVQGISRFTPGIKSNKPVRCIYTAPILFQLQ